MGAIFSFDATHRVGRYHTVSVRRGQVAAKAYSSLNFESNKADAAVIDQFQLLTLAPDYETRVSPKESGKEGFCVNGYLLLRPTNGNATAGILVDGKNRGIRCRDGLAVSDQQLKAEPASQ